MMTVKDVSKLTGISVRTLQYYDQIGLLKPAAYSDAGYRLYDDAALKSLQQILLFRELEFSLKDIRMILHAPDYDRNRVLEQQIALLTMKKEHLENLILFARGIQLLGVNTMDFSAFDKTKLDEYARRAKEEWGNTPQYQEMKQKEQGRTPEQENAIIGDMMRLFTEFGGMRSHDPADESVPRQVKRLQDFITEHLYTCTDQILRGLGKMYAGGGEISENIDRAGGAGTAVFVAKAIAVYCGTD